MSAISRKFSIFLCLLTLSLQILAQDSTSEPVRNPAWATPVDASFNLFRVDDNFYRSARLDEEELPALKSLNIQKVVNLRAFHSDKHVLKNSGIESIQIGIHTWNVTDDDVIAALRAIRSAQKEGPVLLHCWHGADRTGLVSAMYRIVFQDWSREKALDELLHGDYGYHSMWKNIPLYLKNVDIEKIRSAVTSTK